MHLERQLRLQRTVRTRWTAFCFRALRNKSLVPETQIQRDRLLKHGHFPTDFLM